MVVQTVKLAGRKFVILPEKDFRRLQERAEETTAQDRGDVAEATRRKSSGPSRPYPVLRKKRGLN